jgi:Domain of unknown function (DUF4384)/Caspase domain
MTSAHLSLRRVALAAATSGLLCAAAPSHADNHALIMWIGDYGGRADLPGIDLDAANARKIAKLMGVPDSNITEVSQAALTARGVSSALAGLQNRIKEGDKAFIYYSGHGTQGSGTGGTSARCTEAMAVRDGVFLDSDLEAALTKLGAKASQVVMMNDSCFSGGAATRSLAPTIEGAVPKFLPAKANSAVTGAYTCGSAENASRMTRSLGALEKDPRGPQVLYVAASTDAQVSFATARGSLATLVWTACLGASNTDSNGSGSINGEELRACSQAILDKANARQTIMLQGNVKLPLTFTSQASTAVATAPLPPAAPPAPAPAPSPAPAQAAAAPVPAPAPVAAPAPAPAPSPAAPATAAVNAAQALADLSAAADRSYQVRITTARDSLRIGTDLLDFSVSTNREGYLYVLQVGSDGKTFNLLFPNKLDANNFVPVGVHRFPRPAWRVRSAGPAGNSYMLAIVSPDKKDIGRDMDASSVFSNAPATSNATRTLIIEATGAGGGSGRYGASDVVSIREVQ